MSVDPAMQRFVLALDLGEQAVRRHAYALSVSAQVQASARSPLAAPSFVPPQGAGQGAGNPAIRWPLTAGPASSPGVQPGTNAGQQPISPQFGGFQLTSAINANTAAITANTLALQKGGAGRGTSGGGGGKPGGPADPKEFDLSKATREFASFGSTLESMSSRGRASILSLVSSADPSMFSTFSAKVEAVSIAVGEVFVPYVDIASRALHNFAGWFRGLDDTTKEWIGTLGVSAVAIAGLGGALLTTGAWFVSSYNIIRTSTVAQWTWIGATRAAAAAKWLLAASIRGVSTALMFMFANPVGLAITAVAGLTAGVAYLAGAFDKLGTSAGGAGNQIRNTSQVPGIGGGPMPGQPQTLAQAIASLTPQQQQQITAPGQTPVQQAATVDKIEKDLTQQLVQQRTAATTKTQQELQIKQWFDDAEKIADTNPDSLRRRKLLADPNTNQANRQTLADSEARDVFDFVRQKVINTPGMNIPDAEIRKSVKVDDQSGKVTFDPSAISSFTTPNPNLPSIAALEKMLQSIPDIRRLMALPPGPGGNQQQGGGNPYTQNVKLPVNARYTDTMGFLESVQTQALNVGDADAQNQKQILENQLKRLDQLGQLLTDVNGNLKALQDGVAKLKWWR